MIENALRTIAPNFVLTQSFLTFKILRFIILDPIFTRLSTFTNTMNWPMYGKILLSIQDDNIKDRSGKIATLIENDNPRFPVFISRGLSSV